MFTGPNTKVCVVGVAAVPAKRKCGAAGNGFWELADPSFGALWWQRFATVAADDAEVRDCGFVSKR